MGTPDQSTACSPLTIPSRRPQLGVAATARACCPSKHAVKSVTRRANRWLAAIVRPPVSGSDGNRFAIRIASRIPVTRGEGVFSKFERQASVRCRTSVRVGGPDHRRVTMQPSIWSETDPEQKWRPLDLTAEGHVVEIPRARCRSQTISIRTQLIRFVQFPHSVRCG